MSLLQHLRYAFAHDPVRRRDRVPAGAVPVGTAVELTLRVDAGVRGCVTGAYLEVLDAAPSPGSAGGVAAGADAEGADGAAATGMPADGASFAEAAAAARAAAWAAAPMEAVDEGFRARVDTSGEPRVLFYRFRIETDAGVVYYAARTDQLTTAGHAFMLEGDASSACAPGGFQLTAYDGAFQVPAWFPGSIMYQIFPDRFARGDAGIRWGGVDSHARRGWPVEVHEDWNEPPAWGESYDPVDFFGGTLAGIEQKLDYLASLGVEVVYLNPICEARSNHRYDTGDYEAIDPILGTWEDFERLAASARSRGMRLVLDTVLSHTGAASRYFNEAGRARRSHHRRGMGGPDDQGELWCQARLCARPFARFCDELSAAPCSLAVCVGRLERAGGGDVPQIAAPQLSAAAVSEPHEPAFVP